jgi:hypothetical protein
MPEQWRVRCPAYNEMRRDWSAPAVERRGSICVFGWLGLDEKVQAPKGFLKLAVVCPCSCVVVPSSSALSYGISLWILYAFTSVPSASAYSTLLTAKLPACIGSG